MIPGLVMHWGQIFPSGRWEERARRVSGVALRNSRPVPARHCPRTAPAGLCWDLGVLASLVSHSCPRGFPSLGNAELQPGLDVRGMGNPCPGPAGAQRVLGRAFPGTNPEWPGAGTHLEHAAGVGRSRRRLKGHSGAIPDPTGILPDPKGKGTVESFPTPL